MGTKRFVMKFARLVTRQLDWMHLLRRRSTEVFHHLPSMVRRDTTKPGRQDASRYRSRQPRRSSGVISARSGKRSRVARVAPSLQSLLRGGCSSPGRHRAYPRDFAWALSTMDRDLSAAVASSASLSASDGLLTGWNRPHRGGSAHGKSASPGSQ